MCHVCQVQHLCHTKPHAPDNYNELNSCFKEFHNIECEWPLFYALLVIDGVFKKDDEQVEKYQDLLRKRLAVNEFGGKSYI